MLLAFIQFLFLFATAIQVFYLLYFYSRLALYPSKQAAESKSDPPKSQRPVTILICAHNEADNLRKNLHRILNQSYRSFEVLVINHNSTDDSEEILISLSKNYKELNFINFTNKKKTQIGKKVALAFGIEKARHEVLLLTDADCAPKSRFWLAKMERLMSGPTEIGLGFGPYEKRPGFLNKIIRFETNLTATQYFSFALAGIPYMGVGRNMIYTKSLYRNAYKFKKHWDIASGDDDLFVNEVANSKNTAILLDRDTFTFSPPKSTWIEWYRQKSRHMTAGRRYQLHHQILLGLASMTHILHYVAGIFLLFHGYLIIVLLAYVFRITLMLLIFRGIFRKLDDAILIYWLPLIDAAFILYYLVLSPTIFWGNTKKW